MHRQKAGVPTATSTTLAVSVGTFQQRLRQNATGQSANDGNTWSDAGLAAELGADLAAAKGLDAIAAHLRSEAHHAFGHCGALIKRRQLEERFPALRRPADAGNASPYAALEAKVRGRIEALAETQSQQKADVVKRFGPLKKNVRVVLEGSRRISDIVKSLWSVSRQDGAEDQSVQLVARLQETIMQVVWQDHLDVTFETRFDADPPSRAGPQRSTRSS